VYDSKNSLGQLFAVKPDGAVALKADVVVGGGGHVTPTGTFHASRWEQNHVSSNYGSYANTPWNKSLFGLNAFGPYQLHIRELEKRGIYIHGTMGPSWNRFTALNALLSPTSHGCVRMSNADNIHLHELLPNPLGTVVKISTKKDDVPVEAKP
jgi:lipoprotein-anchoring transpeptidase ErfK/SrfK